ncbi:FAD/NAD(P)-binding protein [Streptomyces sp. BE303]|uniref:FAD/NAD(P)-binding protein n=1 Tax=Streptomyces sp. BE303 TaxID=3002528 RepID=UPI002E783983|nr:FAD/NAD(P)-binding protein [Streptomyces sp. BE303]MED7952550.1 FAD/NAD(P)-binding protein [Streptomyces sp. BE303]
MSLPTHQSHPTRHTVAVVGAGAAGALVAIHLCEAALRRNTPLTLLLVDPALAPGSGSAPGAGTAYATRDRRHRLNVPAGGMSCYPEDDTHFVRWLVRHADARTTAADFVPRGLFGSYLADALTDASARARALVTVHRVAATVTGLARQRGRTVLTFADGAELTADSCVLATGPLRSRQSWAPPGLRDSARFVPDPWAPDALAGPLASDGDVLLVGTGLTAVDVALTLDRPGRTLHAVSRGGDLPSPHAVAPLAAVPPAEPLDGLALADLRRAVQRHVRRTVRTHGDWRPALDGLRPLTARLWSALSVEERAEFLARDRSRWNTRRHRMAPATAEALARLREAGRFRPAAGQVAAVREDEPGGTGLVVTLVDGRTLRVRWVVDCTGPATDPARSPDPLHTGLLDAGLARTGPLGMGYATDPDGRLLGADASAPAPLWTLGAHRRGELWETTAVPEIRAQAARIADVLLTRAAAPRTRPAGVRPTDPMGLPLSTDPAAAEAYRTALDLLMAVRAGADEALHRALELDPGFALAHAALAALGHEGGATADVPRALADARSAVRERGDERERSLVEVVAHRVRGTGGDAALLRHLADHPRDVLALGMAVPTIAFSGVTDLQDYAYRLVGRIAPEHDGHWFHTSLLAFIRQEQGDFAAAEQLADRALGVEPAAGHAVHALTHVHYERGNHEEGRRWLDAWIDRHGLGTAHHAHFSWHAGLHELALDDASAVRERWYSQLSPSRVSGVRALVDSASFLWRARLADRWHGATPVTAVLDSIGRESLERPATAFVALHSAMALASAGDLVGLHRLRRHAAWHTDPVQHEVIAPLCDAMTAVVEERWGDAADTLTALRPTLRRAGGSAAQREVVEETLIHALTAAGRYADAERLLRTRLDRRPSPLDRRRVRSLPRHLPTA